MLQQKQIANLISNTFANAKTLNVKVNDIIFIIQNTSIYYAATSVAAESLPSIIVCNNGIRLFISAPIISASYSYYETSVNYVASVSDYTINVTTNNVTITLYSAVGNAGNILNIKNSTNGIVNILPFGSETIDGESVIKIPTPFVCLTLQSTGTNWIII
jgi:hypothetical protein